MEMRQKTLSRLPRSTPPCCVLTGLARILQASSFGQMVFERLHDSLPGDIWSGVRELEVLPKRRCSRTAVRGRMDDGPASAKLEVDLVLHTARRCRVIRCAVMAIVLLCSLWYVACYGSAMY